MDTDVVCRAQGWAKGELLFSWKQELNVAKTLDSPGYIRGGPWPLGAPGMGTAWVVGYKQTHPSIDFKGGLTWSQKLLFYKRIFVSKTDFLRILKQCVKGRKKQLNL